jgi:hypothetical protein
MIARRFVLALGLLVAAKCACALQPLCTPAANTLCLNNGRFSVTAFYQPTPEGPSIDATAVALTDNSGYFWFFDATNVELIVKVLNGCFLPPGAYWFFAAGLTNVGVQIVVKDLASGADTRIYGNEIGTAFVPIQDTAAFSTCP